MSKTSETQDRTATESNYDDYRPKKDNVIYSHESTTENFNEGINTFLKQLDITFRTDKTTNRPRINKHNSAKDVEQKSSNIYFQ